MVSSNFLDLYVLIREAIFEESSDHENKVELTTVMDTDSDTVVFGNENLGCDEFSKFFVSV